MSVVLITGANKGLGRGFVEKYLARPNTTVVAATRDPSGEEAQDLDTLAKGDGSKLLLVKIESTSETDALEAFRSLQSQGVSYLDVVIANAGIFRAEAFLEVAKMKTSDLTEHVDVNVNGPIRLFQATLPLLKAAKQPKFIVISSAVATIANAEYIPYTVAAYGASKAALNFLLRRIHIENPEIIAIAFHPGAVKTNEGNKAAQAFGLPEAFTEITDAVHGVVSKVDVATREESSGKFLAFDDTQLAW